MAEQTNTAEITDAEVPEYALDKLLVHMSYRDRQFIGKYIREMAAGNGDLRLRAALLIERGR